MLNNIYYEIMQTNLMYTNFCMVRMHIIIISLNYEIVKNLTLTYE